jgi:protein-S-isoprenylcysteine O-methyltransferase Ste14
MNLIQIIIVSCWVIVGIYWSVGAFFQKPQSGKINHINRFIHKMYLGISAVLLLGYNIYHPLSIVLIRQSTCSDIMSVVLSILGLFVAVWARIILSDNWSVNVALKKGHELIQTGPYRCIRHPIYAGLLMLFIGTCIAIGRIGGFIGLLILLIGLGVKIRQEESLMIKHFGKKYLDYKNHTKALIPFIL